MATSDLRSESSVIGNETTGQGSETTSATSSAYQNGLARDSSGPKAQSNGDYQPGSGPGAVSVKAETPVPPRSRSSSLSTPNAEHTSGSNQLSNPPPRSSPLQNASPIPLPATQPAMQPAPQPGAHRRRMLPARTPSSNTEPPPRAKRIQVTKKQAAYTTFSQVVDRVFFTALKNEYKYDSLTETDEIRLLVINPAKTLSDPLYCQLVSAINEEIPVCPYEALSYMWGNEHATEPIYMFYPELRGVLAKEGMMKKRSFQMKRLWARFYVRPNLHSALQRLRNYEGHHIYLWVDAICIDQNNNPERSNQVTKMDEIYNRASRVSVWLGSGNMQSKLAFDFMKDLLQGTNLDRFVKDPSSIAHWIALADLMKNQWFSRRWVIQEVALAKEATIHCGGETIYFDEFADAVYSFVQNFDEIAKLLIPTRGASPIGNVKTGAWALCQAIGNYFPKDGDGIINRKASLETLVSQLISFDATEPRDIIYGLLSLAKDTEKGEDLEGSQTLGPVIVPNYDDNIVDVFRDFINFAISQSESLDIICRCWAPIVKLKETPPTTNVRGRTRQHPQRPPNMRLPSWMPSVSNHAYGTPIDHLVGRMNGDSFVGSPEHKLYNATPRTNPVWRFGEKVEKRRPHGSDDSTPPPRVVCNGSMFVRGFILDVIAKVGYPITQGIISREALSLGSWFPEDYSLQDMVEVPKVPDELWRTMVADKGPNGEAPPPTYQRACQKCLAEAVRGDINITKLIQADEDQMMVGFLKRVEAVVWNRSFLRSAGLQYPKMGKYKARSLFGLAPRGTRNGDLICILLGCSVPVILRQNSSTKTKKYELLGEAYIYGMMTGDALGGRKQKQLEEDCIEFELQ